MTTVPPAPRDRLYRGMSVRSSCTHHDGGRSAHVELPVSAANTAGTGVPAGAVSS